MSEQFIFIPGSLLDQAVGVKIEVSVFSYNRKTDIEAEITFTLKDGKKQKYMYYNEDGNICKDFNGRGGFSSVSDAEHQEVDELVEKKMMELIYKFQDKLSKIKENEFYSL